MSAGLGHSRIRAIEEAMFKCRPSLETVMDGNWVWRFAKGYTGRANSLQSLNVKDINSAEERLAGHVQRSRDFGIAPKFRVTPLAGAKIIDLLDAQGWGVQGHTQVLLRACPSGGSVAPPTGGIVAVAPGSNQWQEAIVGLLGLGPPSFEIYREMLAKLPPSARGFLMYKEDGALVSAALGAVADGVGAVFSLTTAPQYQRQGFGKRLMVFVQEYLQKEGAKQIALQVEAKNRPAIALYKLLGYERAYSYTYRTLEAAK